MDWTALAQTLGRERLAPLFHDWIGRFPKVAASVPKDFLEGIKYSYYQTAVRNTLLKEETKTLLQMLVQHRIPFILHKGIHLAETLYGSPALRPMTDVDLLVRHEDKERVNGLLRATKFNTLIADLHTDIINTARFGFVQTEPSRRILRMWRGARPSVFENLPVRTLALEDQLIALCIHLAFNHRLEGLLWHADLVRFVRRFQGQLDWDEATALAGDYESGKSVYYCLKYLKDRWQAEIPMPILEKLKPRRRGWLERTMARRIWRGKPLGKLGYFFSLPQIENKKLRWSYFWLTLKSLKRGARPLPHN